jgi:hypothetical protein
VKHLLIIISLILLSSLVIGQKLVFYVGVKHLNIIPKKTKPKMNEISRNQGVLFLRNVNGELKWFEGVVMRMRT